MSLAVGVLDDVRVAVMVSEMVPDVVGVPDCDAPRVTEAVGAPDTLCVTADDSVLVKVPVPVPDLDDVYVPDWDCETAVDVAVTVAELVSVALQDDPFDGRAVPELVGEVVHDDV